MHRRKRQALLFVSAAVFASSAFLVSPANAATIVVDDDGHATAASCDAAAAAPTTPNGGIALASPGDTVKVCPGLYDGTTTVNVAGLKLIGPKVGVNGATREFVDGQEASLTVVGTVANALDIAADNVTVDGFTMQNSLTGVATNSVNSGHIIRNNIIRGNTIGVYLNSNGANPSLVTRNKMVANNNGLNDPVPPGGAGNGLYTDLGLANATISFNQFTTNRNAGITLTTCGGGYNTNIGITSNKFSTNYTAVSLQENNNNVRIRKNTTNDAFPWNDNLWGTAIFVGGNNTAIQIGGPLLSDGNTIQKSPFNGIAVRDQANCAAAGALPAGGVFIRHNTVNTSLNNGIDVSASAPGRVQVRQNKLNNNGKPRPDLSFAGADGILFGAATIGNTIAGNTVNGSGIFECEDQSTGGGTAGTANTWTANTGTPSSPAGICT